MRHKLNRNNRRMIMAKKRGFASMDAAKQREIASKGGKAAHQKGTAHQFTPEEARAAGRKGGQAAHFKGTAHKFTSEEARAAGRKGGRSARGSVMNPAASTTQPAASDEAPENRENRENRTPEVTNPEQPPRDHGNGMQVPAAMPTTNPEAVGPSA
jgi:general stress protein YciG